MKIKSVLNKAKKLGLNIKKDDRDNYTISSELGYYLIEFYPLNQSDEVDCLTLRRFNDYSDSMTDYFAGSYYYTMKGCFEAMQSLEADRIERINKEALESLEYIEIERMEGPSELCQKTKLSSIAEFNQYIESNLFTFPKIGYDKHRVTLFFKDNSQYEYRLDAKHPLNEYYRALEMDIIKHIESTRDYYRDQFRENKAFQSELQTVNQFLTRLYREVA